MGAGRMWLATMAGAMMLANPAHAASALGASPSADGGAMAVLLALGFLALGAVARRRREARVIC